MTGSYIREARMYEGINDKEFNIEPRIFIALNPKLVGEATGR